MRFKDKVVVVTGGWRGIGFAIGEAFLDEGANVACIDNVDVDLPMRTGGHFFPISDDVSRSGECDFAVERIVGHWGGIDILVNCAGIQPLESYRRIHELDEEVWDRIQDVNLKGYFLMAKYCLPQMMQQGRGVIINIGSVTAHEGAKGISAYSASKAGVDSLTRSIALEYAEYGIRCVGVCPGTVDTERLRTTLTAQTHGVSPEEALAKLGAAHPVGRVGMPTEVASLVLYLASDAASFITGCCIPVDGGGLAKGYYSVG